MRDSFKSFATIDAEKWVINVRGTYKFDTLFFLHEQLGNKLVPYTLESNKGWFYDTRQMLKDIKTDYVFFWLEDHLNLVDTAKYRDILNEMKLSQSEYLSYSFWHSGKTIGTYGGLDQKELPNISTLLFDKAAHHKVSKDKPYIISMLGIFSYDLFKKIIDADVYFLRQWSKFNPLSFEKKYHETRWLPIRYALPKYELFASIDDDHNDAGYCLQSRGLYPRRVAHEDRKVLNPITPSKIFFRTHIRKYIPAFIYTRKIRLGNFLKELRVYLLLLLHGE